MNMLRFCFSSSVITGDMERWKRWEKVREMRRFMSSKIERMYNTYLLGMEIVPQFPFFRGMYSSQKIDCSEDVYIHDAIRGTRGNGVLIVAEWCGAVDISVLTQTVNRFVYIIHPYFYTGSMSYLLHPYGGPNKRHHTSQIVLSDKLGAPSDAPDSLCTRHDTPTTHLLCIRCGVSSPSLPLRQRAGKKTKRLPSSAEQRQESKSRAISIGPYVSAQDFTSVQRLGWLLQPVLFAATHHNS